MIGSGKDLVRVEGMSFNSPSIFVLQKNFRSASQPPARVICCTYHDGMIRDLMILNLSICGAALGFEIVVHREMMEMKSVISKLLC